MTVPEAMQHPPLRRFCLRRQRIPVAGGNLSMVAPRSMDDLLEDRADISEDRLPYWAEIWPAAVGVARLLMRGPSLQGLRVMDLGCGVGLAGIAAGKRGGCVTFVDREQEALEFARFNADHNGVAGTQTLQLDWFLATAPGGFDLLLLADVAYEPRNHEPLLRHVRQCLVAGGRALLGDPFRPQVELFLELVGREMQLQTLTTDTFFRDRRLPMRLCWVTR